MHIPQTSGRREYQLAMAALKRRQIAGALQHIREARRRGYDADECAGCRWWCWMLSGRFEQAWRESDRIAARGRPDPHRLWDGRPFAGKRVLIRCLHGFGDAIQFLRYARSLRSIASHVTVQTHPEMVSLLTGLPLVDEVVDWNTAPVCEQQIEIMELPRAHRTTLESIPSHTPYLHVSKQHTCRSRVPSRQGGKLRVGLQWRSSTWNTARSAGLAELLPILQAGRFEFYSFQRGISRQEAHLLRRYGVIDVSGVSPQIVEAAADLTHIDLLISVDTMLAHLAGALGRPVWVLLPFEADWRWMLDRSDSPWYPTMRLFRQRSPGSWVDPIRHIANALVRNG